MTTIYQPVLNYDFELYDLIILAQFGGAGGLGNEEGSVTFLNKTNGSLSLTVTVSGPSFIASVVGSTVTITLPDGTGKPDGVALINSSPVLSAVLSATWTGSFFGIFPDGSITIAAPSYGASGGLSNISLFDQNKVAISNAPVFDAFMDGIPNDLSGTYGNGAIATPLWYQKDSQIQINVQSNISSSSVIIGLYFYLVGRKYYPC